MSRLIEFLGSGVAVLSDQVVGFDRDSNDNFIVYLKHGGTIKVKHCQLAYEELMKALRENAEEKQNEGKNNRRTSLRPRILERLA